jgi:hypothetical protein
VKSSRSLYTAEHGRELARRLEQMRASGGVSHDSVVRQMLEDMEHDLRQMVRDYDGSEAQAKALLESLVIARENGVTACDEIELQLARRLRKSA